MKTEVRVHPGVEVRVGALAAVIDVAIAPLIREIWTAGIPTMMSCQGSESGFVWIEFAALDHLAEFLNIVAVYEEGADTLYNRIVQERWGESEIPWWQYQLNPLDCGGYPGDDIHPPDNFPGRPCAIVFTVALSIPHADLPEVLARLEQHNRRMADLAV